MFQPQPTAFIPFSTGYGMAHGLPEFTFEETPLGLSGGSGGFGGHPGTAGASSSSGGSGAGGLIFTTPIFSTSGSAVGPAPGSFQFHHPSSGNGTSTTTTTATTSASASSTSATTSPASSVLGLQQRPSPHSQHTYPASSVKMESSHDDMHAQEAAARDYQPDLKGPLVGEKTPSTAITDEYAKADPVYVQKTMALPQTYSDYRPIQGDGNCGWRAIAFSYFETLINSCSKDQLDTERGRIRSLDSYIESVGNVSPFIFQDMSDETFELFQRLSNLMGNRALAMAELTRSFNNPETDNSILYHLRLLASSWLKGNPDSFSQFVTADDLGVAGFCTNHLERPNAEIDHLGVVLLANVLLNPAGFVLEVAYLDRSAGSQVNTYRIPDEAQGRHPSELGPMIHLLFRPDHYDILYRADTALPPQPPPPAAPLNLQVHRATFSQGYEIQSTPTTLHSFGTDISAIALLPGAFDPLPTTLGTGSPISPFEPTPAAPWLSTSFLEPMRPDPAPSMQLPIRKPSAPAALSTEVATGKQKNPVRFSGYCQLQQYVDNGSSTRKEPTFHTASFKNSHFNVAHYNNPNFQPEEYKPGADESDTASRTGKGKRGSV